jgi:hypothetical protein
MKRISLLLIVAALMLALCAPCFAVSRNLVNTAPAIGGKNGRFVCNLLLDVDYDATPTISAAGNITTGITDPPSPALITIDPATAPGTTSADVTTITLTGTDYTDAATTDLYTWTGTVASSVTGTKYFKTITKITTTLTGTAPGATNIGYLAQTRFYVPANTYWVDFEVITTSIVVYVDFTNTAPGVLTSAYTWPTATFKQMGLGGGTWVYFGLSSTASATDRIQIQCWR